MSNPARRVGQQRERGEGQEAVDVPTQDPLPWQEVQASLRAGDDDEVFDDGVAAAGEERGRLLRLERATRRRRAGLLMAQTLERRRLGASSHREDVSDFLDVLPTTPRKESVEVNGGECDEEGGGGCEETCAPRQLAAQVSAALCTFARLGLLTSIRLSIAVIRTKQAA